MSETLATEPRRRARAARRSVVDHEAQENRRPRGLDRNERSLARAIQQRERVYQASAWRMLLVGGVGLFIAPILLASFVVAIEGRMHSAWRLGWWPCVGLASLALIPLLFWIEQRSRGQWLRSDVSGESISIGEALLAPSRETVATTATFAAVAEILLPAPRMILAARERWRTPVSAATLHDAVATLNFLRQSDVDVSIDDLPTVQPLRVLCYLVSREWVTVSQSGDRVRLLPAAKTSLEAYPATIR